MLYLFLADRSVLSRLLKRLTSSRVKPDFCNSIQELHFNNSFSFHLSLSLSFLSLFSVSVSNISFRLSFSFVSSFLFFVSSFLSFVSSRFSFTFSFLSFISSFLSRFASVLLSSRLSLSSFLFLSFLRVSLS